MSTQDTGSNQGGSFRSIMADRSIRALILVVLVVLTGLGVVLPILALYARSFGVGYAGTGALLGAFGFTRLFGDLGAGPIIARKGERWTGAIGMAFLALCATITGLAPNYAVALIAWGLGGIGSAIIFASLFSYILRSAPEGATARTLSYFFAAFNIGIIAGGATGGWVADHFGLAAPLFVYVGLLLIAMVMYLTIVPPLARRSRDDDAPAEPLSIGQMFRIPGFVTAIFLNLMYLWIIVATIDTLIPLFAHDKLGASEGTIGLLYSIVVGAEFFVLFPAGSLADRIGRRKILIPSIAGLIVMVVVLGFASSLVMLSVLLVAFAVCTGFAGVPPAALLNDVVPSEHSGRAVGIFRFCGDLGFFLGPIVTGATSAHFGFKAAFAVTAILPAIALVLTLRTPETLHARSETPSVPVAPV